MPRAMLNGAIEIIRGVSTSHIDPLRLPDIHGYASLGYIVVAYLEEPDCFDVLFLKGRSITACARINRDIRGVQTVDTIRRRLNAAQGRSLVYLFQATEASLDRFARTFHYEPCLKLQCELLSRRQMEALIMTSGCRKGLLEIDRFSGPLPSIELYECGSPEEFLQYQSRLRHGRMILYDVEKNRDLLRHQEPEAPEVLTSRPAPPPVAESHGEVSKELPIELEIPSTDPSVEEFIQLFVGLLEDFRREGHRIVGKHIDDLFQKLEEQLRENSPGFDSTALTKETAPVVLDLIEGVATKKFKIKRGKLRSAALRLVSEFYGRNTELLERYSVIGKVEECYLRLKG